MHFSKIITKRNTSKLKEKITVKGWFNMNHSKDQFHIAKVLRFQNTIYYKFYNSKLQ